MGCRAHCIASAALDDSGMRFRVRAWRRHVEVVVDEVASLEWLYSRSLITKKVRAALRDARLGPLPHHVPVQVTFRYEAPGKILCTVEQVGNGALDVVRAPSARGPQGGAARSA